MKNYRTIEMPDCCGVCEHYKYPDGYDNSRYVFLEYCKIDYRTMVIPPESIFIKKPEDLMNRKERRKAEAIERRRRKKGRQNEG